MTIMSITRQRLDVLDTPAEWEEDLKWEEESYREGCAYARERAIKRLEEIDEKLFKLRPPSLKVIGFRERTLITGFGEIRIKRRLYRDEKGRYRFLLDEYLNLPPEQAASPDLYEGIVTLTTWVPFEKASDGVISKAACHRLLRRAAEEREWQE